MLPDAALRERDVWAALIANGMPQTALMRQLPRLTRLGVLDQLGCHRGVVAAQLADRERLIRARVHPVNVLVALRTYASPATASAAAPPGRRCRRSPTRWTPRSTPRSPPLTPAGKRTMCALDVSGSMTQAAAGLPVSCREATAALALVTAATEPQTLITGFTSGRRGSYESGISTLGISPRQRLDDAIRAVSGLPFGGTDCALPMLWAAQNGVEIDTFEIMTDSETWAGQIHPHQALEQYRQKTGIPARMAVVAMHADRIQHRGSRRSWFARCFGSRFGRARPARRLRPRGHLMDPLREYQEKIRRYEDRGGPMQGHRGTYAHLDPVEPAPVPDPAHARELIRLIKKLAVEPGTRILIMERVAAIERELDAR